MLEMLGNVIKILCHPATRRFPACNGAVSSTRGHIGWTATAVFSVNGEILPPDAIVVDRKTHLIWIQIAALSAVNVWRCAPRIASPCFPTTAQSPGCESGKSGGKMMGGAGGWNRWLQKKNNFFPASLQNTCIE